ncbi:MAG: hypothetical protein DUD39_13065 [Coriobacteriaceae bacterium]|nr:MAG: hypothetical protein DUD39_13065 [Coriobacteriaceae bacterium]
MWHKGSFIGYIARKTGKDRSSVCHKIARTARHKRFSACAAQNPKGGQLPAHGREKPKRGHSDSALAHRKTSVDPQADRLYLRLEYGVSCVVEPLDYSAVRPVAATLELPGVPPSAQEGEANLQQEA